MVDFGIQMAPDQQPRTKIFQCDPVCRVKKDAAEGCQESAEKRLLLYRIQPQDSWFALPSGPAAYVFSDEGILVDWTADSGDDPAFDHQWLRAVQPSTLAELIKSSTRSNP